MKKKFKWISLSKRNQFITLGVFLIILVGVVSIVVSQINKKNALVTEDNLVKTETINIDPKSDINVNNLILIEAETNTELGVPSDSAFILTHQDSVELSQELIETNLQIEPELAFDVEKIKPETYKIHFRAQLPENKILKMKYTYEDEDYGYAFQTVEPFWVRSTYPANESLDVPVETGIEIAFSRPIESSIEAFVEISPAIEGSFSVSDNKLIFLPKTELVELTSYEVIIKEGYIIDEEPLQAKQFKFTTSRNWGSTFAFSGPKVNRLSIDGPQVLFLNGFVEEQKDIDIDIYKIDEQKESVLRVNNRSEIIKIIDATQSGDYYRKIKADVVKMGDYNSMIQLHESLPKGLYYIAPNFGTGNEGGFFQVTSYYAYMVADKEQLVVWIQGDKNLVANVSINNTLVGKTNEEGIGEFSYDFEQNKESLMTLECANDTLYLPMNVREDYVNLREDYYAFLTTDRRVYLPTDTISVNGFIQKRRGVHDFNTVTVQAMYNDRVLESKNVDVTDIGTFTTYFDIQDFNNQWLNIQVLVGNDVVLSYGVNVFEFEKPKFVLNSSLNKKLVTQGESFQWYSRLSYYSGASVLNGSVVLGLLSADQYNKTYLTRTANKRDQVEVGLTSENSEFEETLYAYSDDPVWRPMLINIPSRSDAVDNFYLYQNNYIYLFPSNRMIEGMLTKKDGQGITVAMDAHGIDVTKIKQNMTDPDEFRAEAVSGMPLQVTIVETYIEQVFVKQAYNEIYKETYNIYNYVQHENTVFSQGVVTDATGHIQVDFEEIYPNRSYQIDISGDDTLGHKIIESLYYGNYGYSGNESFEPEYSLKVEADDYNRVNYNSEANITLLKDGNPIESTTTDKMLIIEEHDGIKDYILTDDTEYSFVFDDSYMPNVNMRVVYFTGNFMKTSWLMQETLYLRQESKALDIDITYDKESYRPGETVNYTAKITDNNGKGTQADLNISVVDEAIFAIEESFRDPLPDMFSFNYDFHILGEYLFSYNTDPYWGGAESGGEGGAGAIRSQFENTAYFETKTTDAQGIIRGSFTLPDNITQWRVTLSAFSKEAEASSVKTNVYATLPIFVDVVMEETFLEEDSIGLLIKSAGDLAYKNKQVSLQMSLKDASGNIIVSKNEAILFGEEIIFEIGKLPLGIYQLSAQVSMQTDIDTVTDSLVREFQVVDSREMFRLNQTEKLDKSTTYIHNNNLVHIEIMNQIAADVLDEFMNMTYGRTERRENLVANVLATKYINQVFYKKNSTNMDDSDNNLVVGNGSLLTVNDNFYNSYRINEYILGDNGLISPLQSAQGDALVTATLLNIGADEIVEEYQLDQFRTGFWTIIEQGFGNSLDFGAAMWGLSELGEPMLLRANAAIMAYDSLESIEAKLCLIHTLAVLGETTKAKIMLGELLEVEKIDLRVLDGNKLELGKTKRDDEALRGSLLSLTSELHQWILAENLYNYIKMHVSNDGEEVYSSNKAQMYYYLANRPQPVIEATLEYELSTEKHKETLDYASVLSLSLFPKEVEQFKVTQIHGELVVRKTFIGSSKDIQSSDIATIKKTYQNNRDVNKPITLGDEVLVTFKIDSNVRIPFFMLQDSLPSGLTYLDTVNNSNMGVYADSKGNTTELLCYIPFEDKEKETHRSFSYLAIATLPGEYLSEPALIYIPSNEETVVGEQTWISIK